MNAHSGGQADSSSADRTCEHASPGDASSSRSATGIHRHIDSQRLLLRRCIGRATGPDVSMQHIDSALIPVAKPPAQRSCRISALSQN